MHTPIWLYFNIQFKLIALVNNNWYLDKSNAQTSTQIHNIQNRHLQSKSYIKCSNTFRMQEFQQGFKLKIGIDNIMHNILDMHLEPFFVFLDRRLTEPTPNELRTKKNALRTWKSMHIDGCGSFWI